MAVLRSKRQERLYAGQSRYQRMGERRRRLLDTGLELFGTVGYAETSIGTICARARVTARHFYELFKSRADLLQAVADEIVDDLFTAVAAALASEAENPGRRARAGLAAFIHHLLDDPRRARILCVEVVGLSPELERHRREIIHRFAELVSREAVGIGIVDKAPPPGYTLGALALVAGTYELVIEAVARPGELAAEQLIDELSRLYAGAAARTRSA